MKTISATYLQNGRFTLVRAGNNIMLPILKLLIEDATYEPSKINIQPKLFLWLYYGSFEKELLLLYLNKKKVYVLE